MLKDILYPIIIAVIIGGAIFYRDSWTNDARGEVYTTPKVLSGGVNIQMRYVGSLISNTVTMDELNLIIGRS